MLYALGKGGTQTAGIAQEARLGACDVHRARATERSANSNLDTGMEHAMNHSMMEPGHCMTAIGQV